MRHVMVIAAALAVALQPGVAIADAQNDAGTGGDAPDWPPIYLDAGSYTGELWLAAGDRADAYAAHDGSWRPGNYSARIEGPDVRVEIESGSVLETPVTIHSGYPIYFRVVPAPSAADVAPYAITVTLPPPPSEVDLRVTKLEVTPNGSLYPHDHRVLVTVENAGEVSIASRIHVNAFSRNPGISVLEPIGTADIIIGPGETRRAEMVWNSTGDVGTFNVTAMVSVPFGVVDTDPSNDRLARNVTIVAPVPVVNSIPAAYPVSLARYVLCLRGVCGDL